MKTKNIILTLTAVLFVTFAYSQNFSTDRLGTGADKNAAHNFMDGTGGTANAYSFALAVGGDGDGVCAVCHTPHNAATELPLWDHLSSGTSFTPYPSGAGTTIDGVISAPSGASALCLGCHDGTANLDSYGGNAGVVAMAPGDSYANFTNDLSNDHPISVTYPSDANAPGEQMVLASNLPAGMLFNNSVECASCHSMHQANKIQGLLRVTNDNSALCLTCHAK